jgi:hypothetical protein
MSKGVHLDFYPRFHIGPNPNHPWISPFTGSYGVTWDNFSGLDSRIAIWAIMSKVLFKTKKQGIDFVSKGTAMRLWLDKSPCWKVEGTLQILMEGHEFEESSSDHLGIYLEAIARHVACGDCKGDLAKLKTEDTKL